MLIDSVQIATEIEQSRAQSVANGGNSMDVVAVKNEILNSASVLSPLLTSKGG